MSMLKMEFARRRLWPYFGSARPLTRVVHLEFTAFFLSTSHNYLARICHFITRARDLSFSCLSRALWAMETHFALMIISPTCCIFCSFSMDFCFSKAPLMRTRHLPIRFNWSNLACFWISFRDNLFHFIDICNYFCLVCFSTSNSYFLKDR